MSLSSLKELPCQPKKNKVAREFFYNDALITERETLCHLCHSSSIEEGPLNPCRICPRVYHTDCLAKQGHLSGDRAVETLALSNSKIGWSCCNCENLFDLLSDNEKIDIMETFDLMDTNQDSFINKEEYLIQKGVLQEVTWQGNAQLSSDNGGADI